MIKAGDTVTIKQAFQDEGDDSFIWIAVEDEDGGRVLVETDFGGVFKKTEVFQVYMLETK